MRRLVPLLAALLALLCAAAPAGAARRQVPRGWVGMNIGGLTVSANVKLNTEMDQMVAAGVESLRVPVFWNEVQHAPGPPDWAQLDYVMTHAAIRGLPVLPVVVGTPAWAAVRPGDVYSPPRGTANYAAILTALMRRYGVQGDFWTRNPGLPRDPIRAVQVWNEVSLGGYWSIQPFAHAYVRLLHAAHDAIKGVDPHAHVVLAGLPNFSWRDLGKIYRAGGRRWFDVAAVHPYTSTVRGVVRIVQLNRRTMARYHDSRKPILVGELSWSSGRGQVKETQGFLTTTEAGQAARVRAALPALAAVRRRYRISQVFWFDWMSPPLGSPNAFDYSGLRRRADDGSIVDKPALAAFRDAALRLEGRTR